MSKLCLPASFFALIGFFASGASARWMQPDEAQYAVDFQNEKYVVHADGSCSIETERQVEILKDSARGDAGLYRMSFDGRSSSFEVIEAKTIAPGPSGKSTPVDSSHVEIKPLASSGQGFDEIKQATIGFPDVAVGSKLYVHDRRVVRDPHLPGHFGLSMPLGIYEPVRAFEASFVSDVPLFVEIYDPTGNLTIETGRKGDRWTARFRLKAPVFRRIVEEESAVLEPKSVPWLAISTTDSWAKLAELALPAYEKELDASLPAAYEAILAKAKAQTTDVARIDAVTSGLQDAFRYVGDWAPVKGAYFPRSLGEVARTGFGDCKDFATGAAAILRKLGFQAHVAWVTRGHAFRDPPYSLPSMRFNHAIAFVQKDGVDRFIDPTNISSFAKGIYPDIAGRSALVLFPGAAKPMPIPELRAQDSAVEISMNLDVPAAELKNEKGPSEAAVTASGKASLLGAAALSMTGASLAASRKQIEFSLIKWITKPGDLLDWAFERADFSSRVVSDFESGFRFRKRWRPLRSSVGIGYLVPPAPSAELFDFRREDREGSLDLGEPGSWRREVRFVGRKSVLKKPVACSGKSRWLDFSRRIEKIKAKPPSSIKR